MTSFKNYQKEKVISRIFTYCILYAMFLLFSLNASSKSLRPDFIAPIISSSSTAVGIVGSSFTYTITASNIPTGFNASSLPAGLIVNTITGIISGIPTVAGTFAVIITASNADGSINQNLTITVISAWVLTGNTGTSSNSNFIGTTDNTDLVFRRDNVKSGILAGGTTAFGVNALPNNTNTYSYNVAIGANSLYTDTIGTNNVAIGANSMFKGIASNNVAVGSNSLFDNLSSYNVAIGFNSMYGNTIGEYNVAEGANSLSSNTTGSFNTAIGNSALAGNTTGIENIGIGHSALGVNQGGSGNIAIGIFAASNTTGSSTTGSNNINIGNSTLFANTTGGSNTAMGVLSLSRSTIASFNTAIGIQTLLADTTGQYNTSVGSFANVANGSVSYSISLGNNAIAISNQLAISDSIHTIKAKGLPTGAGYVLTDVSGNGNLSLQPKPVLLSGTTNFVSKFTPTGTLVGNSQIFDDGNLVAIGTISSASTAGYKFAVNGAAIFTKAVIKLYTTWPDFVFDEKYNLPSLIDTKKYIDQNKHLPGLPSASEVEKNGIDVGLTQTALLQKVEELTLYIINQEKEIEELKQQQRQLEQLQKEFDELKKSINKN